MTDLPVGRDDACTFAFVDLAGYTALTEAHGDQEAADIATAFYAMAQGALTGDTRIVKCIGDAVMLVASRSADCVETVLAMFESAQAKADFPVLRAGLYAGSAVERDADYFGAAVNLAARIGAHARSGEVLCGASVANAIAVDARLCTTSLGLVALKNVSHPIDVYSLARAGQQPASGAVDPVCRMRVGVPTVTLDFGGRRYCFCSVNCAAQFQAAPELFV